MLECTLPAVLAGLRTSPDQTPSCVLCVCAQLGFWHRRNFSQYKEADIKFLSRDYSVLESVVNTLSSESSPKSIPDRLNKWNITDCTDDQRSQWLQRGCYCIPPIYMDIITYPCLELGRGWDNLCKEASGVQIDMHVLCDHNLPALVQLMICCRQELTIT